MRGVRCGEDLGQADREKRRDWRTEQTLEPCVDLRVPTLCSDQVIRRPCATLLLSFLIGLYLNFR